MGLLMILISSAVSAASVRNVAVKNVGPMGRSKPFNNEGTFFMITSGVIRADEEYTRTKKQKENYYNLYFSVIIYYLGTPKL